MTKGKSEQQPNQVIALQVFVQTYSISYLLTFYLPIHVPSSTSTEQKRISVFRVGTVKSQSDGWRYLILLQRQEQVTETIIESTTVTWGPSSHFCFSMCEMSVPTSESSSINMSSFPLSHLLKSTRQFKPNSERP